MEGINQHLGEAVHPCHPIKALPSGPTPSILASQCFTKSGRSCVERQTCVAISYHSITVFGWYVRNISILMVGNAESLPTISILILST